MKKKGVEVEAPLKYFDRVPFEFARLPASLLCFDEFVYFRQLFRLSPDWFPAKTGFRRKSSPTPQSRVGR